MASRRHFISSDKPDETEERGGMLSQQTMTFVSHAPKVKPQSALIRRGDLTVPLCLCVR